MKFLFILPLEKKDGEHIKDKIRSTASDKSLFIICISYLCHVNFTRANINLQFMIVSYDNALVTFEARARPSDCHPAVNKFLWWGLI